MTRMSVSRRQLLTGSAAAGAVILAGRNLSSKARSISEELPWQPGEADRPAGAEPGPRTFFTTEEAEFIDAAVARLIPNDELGPGAKEAGVTTFLDRQLAGSYGSATHWYMQGPWKKGEETQGYQSRLTPAELYRSAIKEVDAHCDERFDGRKFSQLSGREQDQVLHDLEGDKVSLKRITASSFFDQLLQNTMEGFFSDPIYGGNRDMVGWNLIGFPGARYDYRPFVDRHGENLNLRPVGLKGRPGWSPD